jgi:hypothetical protein
MSGLALAAPHSALHYLVCFNREQVMADLMRETEDVASKRRAFREMRELLRSALDIVNEVRIVLAT